MRTLKLSLVTLAFTFVCPAVESGFRWHSHLQAGRTLEIKGVNGFIRAEAATGPEAEVSAVKHGNRSDPSTVDIQVVESESGVTICAVYLSDDSSKPNECRAGSGGRMNVRNNDVNVDFTVRVPAGVRFLARNVNGNVEASSLSGDIEAHTVNGSVRVSTTGNAQAKTVNGSIDAKLGAANWPKTLDFQTVNGNITVELPASTSSEVKAETVNGNISTDFPLTVTGKIVGKRLNGTIGSGGRELTLKTVNGNIQLRRV